LKTFIEYICVCFIAHFRVQGRTNFDVTTGWLQNQGYFQRVYCITGEYYFNIITLQLPRLLFLYNLWCCI